MRKGTTATALSLLAKSPHAAMAALFFFAAGISAGVFTELFMTPEARIQMADYLTKSLFSANLSGTALPPVFLRSLVNNAGLLLIILASGLTVIGFPAAFLALAYKGMALGFSSALLLSSMAGKGAAVILLSMVPQNLLLIPAFLAASIAAANLAGRVLSGRQKGVKKSLAQSAGPYLSISFLLTAAIFIACLVEAFICPVLLQLAG